MSQGLLLCIYFLLGLLDHRDGDRTLLFTSQYGLISSEDITQEIFSVGEGVY